MTYEGRWVDGGLRFGTNKDAIGSFFGVRGLGRGRDVSGAGDVKMDAGNDSLDWVPVISSLASDLVGNLTGDISKLDPLCDEAVSEVGMACRRGTVMLLTVTRFEDETADGRDGSEAEGKIR